MKLNKPTVMRRTAVIIALLCGFAAPCQALVYHTIQKDETLAIVAKHYYGDPAKAFLLMEYNGVSDPRSINPGRRIVIPEVKVHRVRKGDSLAFIAKKYLNDPNKSRGLAKLNQIKDPKSISPGMTILIPVEILHTVRTGDSLTRIAQRYYGSTDAFNLIALYNDIKDPASLKPGTRLILPISDLKIITGKSRSQPPTQPKVQPSKGKGEAFLENGVRDYFMGDYLGAVKNLQKAVALGLKDNDDMSKVHRFLAYSYVALNKRDKAKDSFRDALKVDPELRLDPVYVSPKIIEVFQEVEAQKSE
jgi:LysM repeat protein